jgi:hypothetical protein
VRNIVPHKEAVRAFHNAEIRFVLSGGLAMTAHGANTIAFDVDFAYADNPINIERIIAFLPTIHATVIGANSGGITSATLWQASCLHLSTDLGDVNLIREADGVDSFEGLWQRTVSMDLGGFTVRVASVDDLIAMREAVDCKYYLYELLALRKLIAEQEAQTSSENLPDGE